MLQLAVKADPTRELAWHVSRTERKDQPDPPLYICLAVLARHLIAQLQRGETVRFGAVFAVVERWHTEGDHVVREAATIGLLEDLQNTNLHARAGDNGIS